jgi:hypothetical protein
MSVASAKRERKRVLYERGPPNDPASRKRLDAALHTVPDLDEDDLSYGRRR